MCLWAGWEPSPEALAPSGFLGRKSEIDPAGSEHCSPDSAGEGNWQQQLLPHFREGQTEVGEAQRGRTVDCLPPSWACLWRAAGRSHPHRVTVRLFLFDLGPYPATLRDVSWRCWGWHRAHADPLW